MPPTKKRRTKAGPDPDAMYIAIDSGAVGTAPANASVVREGDRLRGDDPRVQGAAHLFVPDGATDDEKRKARLALRGSPDGVQEPDAGTPSVPAPLRDEDAVVAIRNVPAEEGSISGGIVPGERVAKSSPVVRKHPDAFVPVAPAGVSRERALVARSTLVTEDDDEGRGRVVWAGTWVDGEDPIVTVHPHQFARLPEEVAT